MTAGPRENVVWADFNASASRASSQAFGVGGGSPPGGQMPPDSGGRDVDIAKLATHVTRLKVLLGALAAVSLAVAIGLFNQIDNRFDKVDGPLTDMREKVAGQASTLDAIRSDLGRIEDKLDNDNEPKTGQEKR